MADTNGKYDTVIGPDAVFKGELRFDKGVHLLGTFEGQINSKGQLLIAESARLSGQVSAADVRVDGDVRANLNATGKVHLSGTARLEGDLHTSRLEVADGAVFIGHCQVGVSTDGKIPPPRAGGPNSGKGKIIQPEAVAAKK